MEVGEIKLEPKEGAEERPILLDEVTYERRTLLEERTDENPILLDSISPVTCESPNRAQIQVNHHSHIYWMV